MKMKRLTALLLMLCMVVCMLPAIHTHAAAAEDMVITKNEPIQLAAPKQDYMTLEEAGAYLAQKMAARESGFPLYFKIERADVQTSSHAWESLLNEAHKHTGDGKLGDVLRWAQYQAGYGGADYHDGTAYYANWEMVSLLYYTTAQQEQILDQKVSTILGNLSLNGKSDYEKIKAIYEYVCKNVTYAQSAVDGTYAPDSPEYNRAYSAYGALCCGEATCQGFSTAIYRLMLEAGIDCRLIAGDDHGWNIVALDGKYYLVDATWDSDHWRATGEFAWFLKGSASFRDNGHREWNFYTSDDYAKYNIPELDYSAPTYGPAEVIASGSCGDMGDNVVWNLTGDGTLTLTGTGKTGDYAWLYSPWQGYTGYIKKLVIGEGITGIGNYLFYNCTALTQIQFPATLTSIGVSSFACCDGLTELTLPNNITKLDKEAFAMCFNLKKITLSKGVEEIPDSLLLNCVRLEEVNLGNNVKKIGVKAFAGCSKLKGITFPSSLTSIDNAAFTGAFDPEAKVKLVIPKNVTYIGNDCFAISGLYEVDWKAATPTVQSNTFNSCRKLEKVTLSDDISAIGDACFQACSLLREVKLPANLQTVGSELFGRCLSLKSILLPQSLTVIGFCMFSYSGLETLTLHEGITTIERYAFDGSKLKEITLPASLASLGTAAFRDCMQLQKITFQGDFPQIDGLAPYVMHGVRGEAYYPYGNATWTEEAIESLTPETAYFNWRTKHPAGAEHIPIIDYQMQYDVNGHWWNCRGCDEKVNYGEHTLTDMIQDGDKWYRSCTTCEANIYYAHEHTWIPANCYQPKTCSFCGETEGEPLTHDIREATCTLDEMCLKCGTVFAPATGHRHIQQATCTTPEKCLDCGVTLSNPAGHSWLVATCDNPKTCTTCGVTEGSANDHTWRKATCTSPKTCTGCGTTEGSALGHNWKDATCDKPMICTRCKASSGRPAGHRYDNGVDGTCNGCGVHRETTENRTVMHMFRMYDPNSGEHFYTGSEAERDFLVTAGWNYEGVGFTFSRTTGMPVYRLYDPVYGEHLYTMDVAEKDALIALGWNLEGVAFNSAYNTEVPQYRLHNPNAKRGAYHFTASIAERDMLIALGWEYQGIGFYSAWN